MDDYFKRFRGRVDRRHVASATIAVVGVGLVGGHVALELARLVPKRLILVDGDDYEVANLGGHPLPAEFVGQNKAVAMSEFLRRETLGIENVTALPHFVEPGARLIATVIESATILIVATDDLAIQRHVADLARIAEVPALVPGIAEDGSRGEVFLSLTENEPCLTCFDGYRPAGSRVRGAAVVAPDAYPAVHLTFNLALAALDGDSPEAAALLSPLRPHGPVPQLFRAWPPGAPELSHADPGPTEVLWRESCPGCGGPPRRAVGRSRQEQVRAVPASELTQSDQLLLGVALGVFLVAAVSAVIAFVLMLMIFSAGAGIWIGRRRPS